MLQNIKRPTLLLDRAKCLSNIRFMAEKAKKHHLIFRPHFKTHQSAAIGEWFRNEGVEAITVSSVQMAQYFALHGWQDITISFPVNIREILEINQLAAQVHLNLLVESPEVVHFLKHNLTASADIFIKIDTGLHRSGIDPADLIMIEKIIEAIQQSDKMIFLGFLTHAGHTYGSKNKNDILIIHRQSLDQMVGLKNAFSEFQPLISIGDTPSCSISDDFSGADEIRPGNFVFYDMMQAETGSCTYGQIAVALICPVVASYPKRSEHVIYGGAIHLSKDSIRYSNGLTSFGRIAIFNGNHWQILPEGNEVISVSQEHGIVKLQPEFYDSFIPGGLMAVIPIHSCLTAHQIKQYLTLDGEIISMML